MAELLAQPVKLPCGLVFPNRLASLVEQLSPKDHKPGQQFENVYRKWGSGGWGAISTGNVMIDERHCGGPGDLVMESDPNERPLDAWKRYAMACQEEGTPAIVQLNHPGRQSPVVSKNKRGFWEKTLAPSAIPLDIGDSWFATAIRAFMFGTPKEMPIDDIQDAVRKFADAAKLMSEAGFAGVEIHAAHGYLIAQFLSNKSNHRTDEYGGCPANRAKFAVEIIRAIRAVVPKTFCVSIKFNSADHQHARSLEETMEQIACIVEAGIDYLEISGGTYEDPQMMQVQARNAKTSAREAFFLDFAKAVRARFPKLILMVTGGFRTRGGMEAALAEDVCDLIGIGRPSVINPSLPKQVLLNNEVPDDAVQLHLNPVSLPWLLSWVPPRALGAGAETEYNDRQIHAVAKGKQAFAPSGSHVDPRLWKEYGGQL